MYLNFNNLIERFGEIAAWHFLAEIEKAAKIKPQYGIIDPEARLNNALGAQDAMAAIITGQQDMSQHFAA